MGKMVMALLKKVTLERVINALIMGAIAGYFEWRARDAEYTAAHATSVAGTAKSAADTASATATSTKEDSKASTLRNEDTLRWISIIYNETADQLEAMRTKVAVVEGQLRGLPCAANGNPAAADKIKEVKLPRRRLPTIDPDKLVSNKPEEREAEIEKLRVAVPQQRQLQQELRQLQQQVKQMQQMQTPQQQQQQQQTPPQQQQSP